MENIRNDGPVIGRGKMEEVRNVDGVRVLRVSGVFTSETIPEMQKICQEAGSGSETKGVLLDLSGVEKIDTSAFACMINFIKEHSKKDVGIGVINIGKRGEGFLEILKIDLAIRVYGSEQEGVQGLSSPGKDGGYNGRI